MDTRLEQTVETGKNASTAGLWRCWQSPCSKIEMSVSWVQWTKKPDEYRKWRMDFFFPLPLLQVNAAEGRELAKQFSCVFCEVSAADPAESEPEDLADIFNQLIKEARSFKIRQQDANNNANNNNGSSHNSRQRKRSVYIINRMLGSLMGRNSMPPELPSSRKGGTSQMASSMPNVAGSFRSVFKKRSV